MSFLDNLENSLKALEGQEERDGSARQRRDDERSRSLAIAPWAERLKTSAYAKQLLDSSAAAGHRIRTKIYMAWIESTLRLEAKGRMLELRPTPDGIVAAFITPEGEERTEAVDLNDTPDELLRKWLG
jgi:hypothetical protein